MDITKIQSASSQDQDSGSTEAFQILPFRRQMCDFFDETQGGDGLL